MTARPERSHTYGCQKNAKRQNYKRTLDRAWFQPLENALQRRDLAAIDLVLTQGSGMMTFVARRANLFGRWRYRWSKPSLLNLLAIERQAM